jgi:ubiquinone/menaquinone biosynthesis C-methylase UbiE
MTALIGKRPDAIALDMGCGGGHASFYLAPLVSKVVACDLSQAMLLAVGEEARRRGLDNVVTKHTAAESLPCPSGSFDVAVTRYSAHHWRDVPGGLAQLRRVLKQSGILIVMDVASPGVPLLDTWLQSFELLRDPSHVCNASADEWRNALTAAGFAVGEVTKFKLRLDFASWIERMKSPPQHVTAIRSLQRSAPGEVREYFAIEDDGSFTVDTILVTSEPSAFGD